MAATNRRPQGPRLAGPVPLQPAPLQSDTYAAPVQRQAGGKAFALAQSLSGFEQGLERFGVALKDKLSEDADLHAAQIIAGRPASEWSEMVRNGSIPNIANPYVRLAVEKTAGQLYGREWMNGIQDRISSNEFDPMGQDFDQLITGLQAEEMENLGPRGRMVLRGFMEETGNFRDWGIEYQQGQVAAAAQQEVRQTSFSQFTMLGSDMLSDPNVTPRQFHNQMNAIAGELGTSLFLTQDQIDTQIINYAATIATTHPEHAIALMQNGRTGVDGAFVGGYDTLELTSQQAGRIIADATRQLAVNTEADFVEGVAQTNLQLINAGSVQTIQDVVYFSPVTNTQVVIPRQTQIDEAVRRQTAAIHAGVTEDPNSATGAFLEELELHAANGTVNEAWQGQLEALPGTLNQASLSDPESMERITEGFALYQEMNNRVPGYLSGILDESTQNFYWAYETAIDLGQSHEEAARVALDVHTNGIPRAAIPSAAIRTAINGGLLGGGIGDMLNRPGWFTGASPDDLRLRQRVQDAAEWIYSQGGAVDAETAVTAAMEMVRSQSFEINGWLVDRRAIPSMPEAWESYATDLVRDVFDEEISEVYPDLRLNDVKVVHSDGLGVFMLTTTQGTPLQSRDGTFITFTADQASRYGNQVVEPRIEASQTQIIHTPDGMRLLIGAEVTEYNEGMAAYQATRDAERQADVLAGIITEQNEPEGMVIRGNSGGSNLPRLSWFGLGNAREDAAAAGLTAPAAPDHPLAYQAPAWVPDAAAIRSVVLADTPSPVEATPEVREDAMTWLNRNPVTFGTLNREAFFMMMTASGLNRNDLIDVLSTNWNMTFNRIVRRLNNVSN